MAETTKWVDPRQAADAAILREMDGRKHWEQRKRDRLVAAAAAPQAYDDWIVAHPDASEEEVEAKSRALREAVESAEADLAHIDRMLASQASRVAAARKRRDEVAWDFFLAEEKKLQPTGRDLLQSFLELPPIKWKARLPELMLVCILVERNRADIAYLGRQGQYPENNLPLPGYCESVPQLMRFFGLMSGRVMNGLAGRIVVKQP